MLAKSLTTSGSRWRNTYYIDNLSYALHTRLHRAIVHRDDKTSKT